MCVPPGRLIAIQQLLGPLPAALVNNLDNEVGHRGASSKTLHLSNASTGLSFPTAFAALSGMPAPVVEDQGWRAPSRAKWHILTSRWY
jgi:hypothetical protein